MTLAYRRLLLALDGTPWAERLLELVERWTAPMLTAVALVHVVEEDGPKRVHGEEHLHDADTAAGYLERCAERLHRSGRPTVCVVRRARTRDVARTLVAEADRLESDALLLATHGRVDPRRWFRGSLAQQVLARTRRDVFQTTPRSPIPPPGPRCLLVPLDGEHAHETAFLRALWLVGETGGSVFLVHVLSDPGEGDGLGSLRARFAPHAGRILEQRRARLRAEYLERCVRRARTENVRVGTLVERGDPATVVAALARRLGADLVVLASHGRHGLASLGQEHLPGRLVERLEVPLLMVPAGPRTGTGAGSFATAPTRIAPPGVEN
jgi:nucleotide-binding universal stress UspA family protein